MSMHTPIAAAAVLAVTVSFASAADIDGALSVGDGYGLPLFVQDTPTGFGNNLDTSPLTAGGSELNALYASVSGGNLNLLLTGNLETNFNRLVLFFDTGAGGDNVVGTSTTDTSAGGGALNDYNGLTFDTGFTANNFLFINGGGSPVTFFADFVTIGGTGAFIGQTPGGAQATTFTNGIEFAFDNSNVLGVDALSAAGALTATTGFEFAIPLTVLGNPDVVSVAGFIAGGNFLSNQVIGGVGGAVNLGTASGVNFNQFAGNQFVTVVIPEPTSALGLAAGLGLLAVRRRR